ncbi:MAG: hypothetical protein ACR2IE_17225 [Candidatus Sumerlaeaceae bacterium]
MAGASIEQAISKLQEILVAVSDCNAALDATYADVNAAKESREALLKEVETDWSDLIRVADGFSDSLLQHENRITSSQQEKSAACTDMSAQVKACFGAAESTIDSLPVAIADASAAAHEAVAVLQQANNEIGAQITSVIETLESTADVTADAFTSVQQALELLVQQVNSFSQQLTPAFSDACTEIGEHSLLKAETAFDEFATQLQENVTVSLDDTLQAMPTGILESISNMFDDADKLAAALKEAADQAIDGFADAVKEETATLREAFENALDKSVSGITQEMAQAAEVMNNMVSCTESLSPVLPVLQLADKVLGEFNAILEEMSPG